MLRVTTLGKFQLSNDEKVLNDETIRSSMLTKLLIYLIIHREQAATIDELSNALWQEEEIDNPAGALKNLMYRLRNLLKRNFGDHEFILTNRGSYCWNPEVKLEVDCERFEILCENVKKEELSKDETILLYEEALELYQGDFMPHIAEMHWCVTLTTYYHSLYLSSAKKLAELYIQSERYDELEVICSQALTIDNVDEQLNYDLIYAHMKNNKMRLALDSYEKACKILSDELGIRNSVKLQEIYEEILQMTKSVGPENILEVQKDMSEDDPVGVFMCGYPVFREIYRLEARKIMRLEQAEYVLLLTLKTSDSKTDQLDRVDMFRMNKAMAKLESTLKNTLRLGDVASKYSDSQFVVLLPSCTYEDGMLVARRIIEKFENEYRLDSNFKIRINLEEVTSVNGMID